MADKEFEKIAEDVDAEDGEVFRLVEVEVGLGHVGFVDGEKLGEDEPRLVDRAHPGRVVVGGKGDLKMVFVSRVGGDARQVARDGVSSGGEEMLEVGGDEALPVAVVFVVGGGWIREEPVADAGCVALVGDFVEALEAVEEDGINAAEAEARIGVGLEAEVFHSVFWRCARSW